MVKRGNRLIAMAMALMISLVSSGSALTAYATEMVPGTEAVVENGISQLQLATVFSSVSVGKVILAVFQQRMN